MHLLDIIAFVVGTIEWCNTVENSAAPQFLFNKSFYHLLRRQLFLEEACIWCLTIAKKQTSAFLQVPSGIVQ